MNKTVHS